MFHIYRMVNTVNGHGYVGFTGRTIAARMRGHRTAAKNGKPWVLHAAIRKHGFEAFRVEEIATAETRDDAVAFEQHFISLFNTRAPEGYNLTAGGDGARGYRHTLEWRAEIGRRSRGRKMAPAAIEAMRTALTGRKMSAEACRKMSMGQTGRTHTTETKQKQREAAFRRPKRVCTPEEAARLRVLASGSTRSLEHRQAISKALTGLKRSDATKAKMKLAAQRRERQKKRDMASAPETV